MAADQTRRAVLAATAGLLLARRAAAQSTAPAANDVVTGEAQVTTAGGPIDAIFAHPSGAGPFPVVLVAENGTGLDRVVIDACHGLAKEGYLAIAPALFAGDPPDGTLMQRLDSARAWAAQNGGDAARLGIVGFGPGGRAAWLFDAYQPGLKAAIAWNGPLQGAVSPARPMTALDAAARLHAPLLGLYGKTDGVPQRILLDAEARAKQAGKVADMVEYVGAGQNFAVASTPGYDAAATIDGWQRTLAWLRKNGVG